MDIQVDRLAESLAEMRGLLENRREAHRKTWLQLEQVTGLLSRAAIYVNESAAAGSRTAALLERDIGAALLLQADCL